jgi:TadE-like protein
MVEGALREDPVTGSAPKGPSRPRGHFGVLNGKPVWRRLRDASGQSLVEFALVLLPLCLLVMGIIDFGWIFKNYIGVREGVRDAARQVSVGNFGTDSSCSSIAGGGLTGAGGYSTNVQKVLCLVHLDDDLKDDGITRVALVVGASSGASYATGQPITICEQYQVKSLTGAFSYITSAVHGVVTKSTQIVETAPAGALVPGTYGETPLFGGPTWTSLCPAPNPVT